MVQTPRRNGLPLSAGDLLFTDLSRRPFRTNWLTVGIQSSILNLATLHASKNLVVVTRGRSVFLSLQLGMD